MAQTVRLTKIHKALKPYIARCAALAGEGLPAMRPDFWPEMDAKKSRDMYSYFLGDELFVCPVLKRGAEKRKLWLPRGQWVHLWSGKTYKGGKKIKVEAPLGRIPVFYHKDEEHAALFRDVAAL